MNFWERINPHQTVAQQPAAPQVFYPQQFSIPPIQGQAQGINPMYTRQGPDNSLAPLAMYQAFKDGNSQPGQSNQIPVGGK